ncbi:MAG: hypothetical protein QM689_07515 [Oscillospiraceae bacterium]
MNIKRIIGLGVTAAVLVFGFVLVKNLFLSGEEKPVKDLIRGINKEDADVFFRAFPDALVEEELSDDDIDEFSDGVKDVKELVGDWVDDDDYKLTYDVMGKEKVDDGWLDQINDLYEAADITVEKAYYLDLKLKMKKDEDDLEATIGVVVGKVDGDWKLVGGDGLVMVALVPNMIAYTATAKIDAANANARSVYYAASEAMTDLRSGGSLPQVRVTTTDIAVNDVYPSSFMTSSDLIPAINSQLSDSMDGKCYCVYIDASGDIDRVIYADSPDSVVGVYGANGSDLSDYVNMLDHVSVTFAEYLETYPN